MKEILSICKRLFSVILGCAVLLGGYSIATAEQFRERGLGNIAPDDPSVIMRIGTSTGQETKPSIEVFAPPVLGEIKNSVLSPDGRLMAVTDGKNLSIIDTTNKKLVRSFIAPTTSGNGNYHGYYALAFDPKGAYIYWGYGLETTAQHYQSWNGVVIDNAERVSYVRYSMFEASNPIYFRSSLGWVGPLAVSPDGRHLIAGHHGVIAIWDISKTNIIEKILCEGDVVSFSRDVRYGLCAPSFRENIYFRLDALNPRRDFSIRLIDIVDPGNRTVI